jgi:hypothetical protein
MLRVTVRASLLTFFFFAARFDWLVLADSPASIKKDKRRKNTVQEDENEPEEPAGEVQATGEDERSKLQQTVQIPVTIDIDEKATHNETKKKKSKKSKTKKLQNELEHVAAVKGEHAEEPIHDVELAHHKKKKNNNRKKEKLQSKRDDEEDSTVTSLIADFGHFLRSICRS